jgi:tRNA dimethylallyltransferase
MIKPKIIVIVGPTASGKTALAIDLALRLNGEIISADSRQIYKELDLGSGKVSAEEMRGVKHHLLDVTDLTQVYTGTNFVCDANSAIGDIVSRGRLPIIAGGTFFYIELLKGTNQSAPVAPNPTLRAKLETLSDEELFENLKQLDQERAERIDRYNRRRLIRSLEIIDALGKVPRLEKADSAFDWLTIGIKIDKNILSQRIEKRLNERLEEGMVDEVRNLLNSGVTPQRLHDLGLEYRYITEYLENKISYEEMKIILNTKIRQFAKRQHTWLKRDKDITWFEFPIETEKVVEATRNFLNNTQKHNL